MSKKYTLSVPLMDASMTPENREIYLSQFKAAGADRIFLVVDRCFDIETARQQAQHAKGNVEFLQQHGFSTVIWVGATIGHGCFLAHETPYSLPDFTKMHFATGEEVTATFCPLDESFCDCTAQIVAEYARTGTDTVILDDDFGIKKYGDELCCFCELHMEKYRTMLGEPGLTREQMDDCVKSGGKNRYRDSFLQVNGDALRGLAKKIRAAVDAVDPLVRVGNCVNPSTFGVDGITAGELARLLAGKGNQPIFRATGAPYWSIVYTSPAISTAVAQMYGAMYRDSGIEVIAEGDSYPRPSSVVPASYLEVYDAVLRAEGCYDGILKYMIDYVSTAQYETAYLDQHCRDLPALEMTERWFAGGSPRGIRVYEYEDLTADADCSEIPMRIAVPYPMAGGMLYTNSVPVQWYGDAPCGMVFGESAQRLPVDKIGNGLILDALSANILYRTGVDIGLVSTDGFTQTEVAFEEFSQQNEVLSVFQGGCRLMRAELRSGAVIESRSKSGEVLSYRYENADGQRFLVFLFDALSVNHHSVLLGSYARQAQLISAAQWIGRQSLPAVCRKHPSLITVCAEKDGGLQIGLFNAHADPVLNPEIVLNREYGELSAYRCDAVLNGNRVKLNSDIPPYSFALISVK